ncbi:MAG: Do family serine endopeptidase [Planctomycetota bacterium]
MLIAGASWVDADSARREPLAGLSPVEKQAIESANHLSTAFRTVANRLLPSVVAIENRPATKPRQEMAQLPRQFGSNPFKGTPLEDMFRDFERRGIPNTPRRGIPSPSAGIGSGVIIDSSGIILTNNHVVQGGGEVKVRTHDGREFIASEVLTDPKSDLAVVKIDDASDFVAATLGDSDQTEIGDWVMALGQPFGLESTVTAGIISAKHRGLGIARRENFLQTDAAINPGNSGGPLVNLRGEVIGINTAIHSRSGGNNGVGFAVPSNLARWVSNQLRSGGSVRRAYLGIGIQPVDQDLAKQLSVKPRSGVVVTDVYPNTPAAKSGLQSGDLIIRFDDREVTSPRTLQLAVERTEIGSRVPLVVMRDGKRQTLTFRSAEQPEDFDRLTRKKPSAPSQEAFNELGLEVTELDAEIAAQLGLQTGSSGVLIESVARGGLASIAGLQSGMVISEVNRKRVTTVDEFAAATESFREGSERSLLLLVRSAEGSRFLVLKR